MQSLGRAKQCANAPHWLARSVDGVAAILNKRVKFCESLSPNLSPKQEDVSDHREEGVNDNERIRYDFTPKAVNKEKKAHGYGN